MSHTTRTLYVRNLNQKVTTNKLKNGLERLFNSSGFNVLNIQASKNKRLRGQAFVSFRKDVDIKDVMDALNTEMLFDMPIHLQIAKTDSDGVLQQNLTEKEFQNYIKKQRFQRLHNRNKKTTVNENKRQLDESDENSENSQQITTISNKNKRMKETPNKMMILTLLPNDTTKEMLVDIFSKFKGFLTVNYVSIRHLALIEFQTEQNSIDCRESLGSTLKVGNKTDCLLTFAKK